MAVVTKISWSEHTWNPWRGCTRVSEGCRHCFMFSEQKRYGHDPRIVVRTKTWGDPIKWQRGAADAGRLETVFTCSWSDWFHADADGWRDEAWEVIRNCPNLQFQVLTKRADRIADHLPTDWGDGYQNVWLGVSVEDEHSLRRLPHLLAVPARVKFVSAEPLLEPINFRPYLYGIDWLIAGCESKGPGLGRECQLDWLRDLRDQCRESGTAYFLKQAAVNGKLDKTSILDGELWRELPLQLIEAR